MAGVARKPARARVKSSTDADEDRNSCSVRPRPRIRKDRVSHQSIIRILDVNLKVLLLLCVAVVLMGSFVISRLIKLADGETRIPRVVTPLPAPKLMDLPMFQGEHRESFYWGTYRPNVYFGVRSRTPQSLVGGLMWLGIKDGRYVLRHVCQDADELNSYGWTHHNGRDYGHQVLVDQKLTIATNFLKSKTHGSGYGGDWAVQIAAQIEITEHSEEAFRTVHLFFYMANEDGSAINLGEGIMNNVNDEISVLASGTGKDIGDWELHLKSMDHYDVHYSGFTTPHIHNLSDLVLGNLAAQASKYGRLQLSDTLDDSPNILVFQIVAQVSFNADLVFVSGTCSNDSRVEERVSHLTGSLLKSQLEVRQAEFDKKFQRLFNLSHKLDSDSITVGKAALGNLLGGIGYFFGQSKISLPESVNPKDGDNFISYWPAELYTAVPSRPFFPRGFLWDEGFHQLLIWRWDIYISLDIIGHWLDLMNIDGWIPREQILGAEALSKVPGEFVLQHPTNGNPPTLFLVLRDIVCSLKRNKFSEVERTEISSFLDRAFVRLEAWFQWFNTTQSGKDASSYFWHGRDNATTRELNPKTLSSGLDDYPRASHPSDDERHLDIRCWMLLAADCIDSISKVLAKEIKYGKGYSSTAKQLSDFELLNQMHFDKDMGAYFDFGNHTEKVRLSWQVVENVNNFPSRQLVREVMEKPQLSLVPHIGYVSLFPFISKIIPTNSWILDKQLDIISNRSTLWTNFGLRSLSKTSSLYMKRNTEHDPPYWRGPIWMNLNYMVLSALNYYSKENGPFREKAELIYSDLRSSLIRNVVKNYRQTGYFWEQYDQKSGKGKGARVFTGWTSLVLLMMSETYHEC